MISTHPLHDRSIPTVFYFAVGAEDTLYKDPFNQPVKFLVEQGIRVVTFSLPLHEEPQRGIEKWAEAYKNGHDILTPFFDEVSETILALDLDWKKTAIMGLSRGAFIGAHILTRLDPIPYLLGFAPLTMLEMAEEFQKIGVVPNLPLDLEALSHHSIRFYIGNDDTRVSTDRCYSFIRELVEKAKERQKREIPIELIIGSSVGFKGHGTLPHVFKAGTDWIARSFS